MRHHQDVPYRLLHCNGKLSAGDPDSENLLVHGDNLEALKALMPHYAGKVKCIYIDPPYNTGNEQWRYNDKVNSPQIQKWLDKVVGGEADDMCRHDKWLCMMYPRLRLLQDFLRPDGVIFVSIDDNEVSNLRLLMNDVFGVGNFVASLVWRKKSGGGMDSEYFAREHEYILCYRKTESFQLNFRTEKIGLHDYPKTKNGRRCRFVKLEKWGAGSYRDSAPTLHYAIKDPDGNDFLPQAPDGQEGRWRKKPENLDDAHTHWEKRNGRWTPYEVQYRDENGDTKILKDRTILYDVATTTDATREQQAVFGMKIFDNSKPLGLLTRLIDLSGGEHALVLDSFAGSGTTAHAVLSLNEKDGGDRNFICVEMDDDICENVTAKRLNTVIKGKAGKQPVKALGGGFRYCTLGVPLFDEHGKINKSVKFSDLAAHVFFSETGTPIRKRASGKTPLIGVHGNKAVYLLYNGVIADKSPDGGNVLTGATLKLLPPHPRKGGVRVVYAAGSRLGTTRLLREKIILKQMPYEIKTR